MTDIFSILTTEFLQEPVWMWLVFLTLVLSLLALDLGLFHRKNHEIELRESLLLFGFYLLIGLLFGGWVWWNLGETKGVEYLTGFIVEKTLAMDNIFVIAMIFGYFQIPRIYQHRVLFWGILGVLILRGIMIGLGTALLHNYAWVLYIFAAFLVFTGIKMLLPGDDEEYDIGNNPALKLMRKYLRITASLHGNKFMVRQPQTEGGKPVWFVTPLFVALVTVEIADVIFAVDSIPAIFSITTDSYIVYTSNIFAILGLRALFFVLAALLNRFSYLKYALSVVLIFIGSKVFITDLLGLAKFPPLLSLGITVGILAIGMIWSLIKTGREENGQNPAEAKNSEALEKTETAV